MNAALPPALLFFLFAAISFLGLRVALNGFARSNRAPYAAPALILFGAASGVLFHNLRLHQYFIWHVILFALVILSWHTKSRVDDKKLIEMAHTGADPRDPSTTKLVESYALTRRLLGFGLVSYLAAFSASYYYLFTHG
jgi:hypothetical protein